MRRDELEAVGPCTDRHRSAGVRRGWIGTVAAIAVIAIVGGTLAQLGRLRMQRLDSVRDRRDRLEAESAARTWREIADDGPFAAGTRIWTDPATERSWKVTIAPSDGPTGWHLLIGADADQAPPLARLDLTIPTNPASEPIE
ncbi:MAG TPA: hypothetical protein DCQ98_10790 [Planctomycetaceae bacterium]|nr:hypothetical protein [Planctomycetaceae bacterium]HRE99708.1 hypothetical protein [Pirellulaceae bacterium]